VEIEVEGGRLSGITAIDRSAVCVKWRLDIV
jgi:hypothetical protein